MDKVIIDGVDVSECKYYDDGTCCDKDVTSISCENTDCIYKQLQRARAEIEKYQNGDIHWNTYSGVFKAFDKDGNEVKFPTENTNYYIKQLKAENERLKAENEKLKEDREQIYKELIHREQLYNIKIDAYIQCLKEIKEILRG